MATLNAINTTSTMKSAGLHAGQRREVPGRTRQGAARRGPADQGRRRPAGGRDRHGRLGHARQPGAERRRLDARPAHRARAAPSPRSPPTSGPGMPGVNVVTLSEFGRRVEENGSGGVDHGHGNAVFLLGAGVNGGQVLGRWPGVAPGALDDGDLAGTTDYRDRPGRAAREARRPQRRPGLPRPRQRPARRDQARVCARSQRLRAADWRHGSAAARQARDRDRWQSRYRPGHRRCPGGSRAPTSPSSPAARRRCRRPPRRLSVHGTRIVAVTADTTDDEQVRDMVASVVAELGGVDILVNCAATPASSGPTPTLETLTDEALHARARHQGRRLPALRPRGCPAPEGRRAGAGSSASPGSTPATQARSPARYATSPSPR